MMEPKNENLIAETTCICMRHNKWLIPVALLLLLAIFNMRQSHAQSVGEKLFNQSCLVCHSLGTERKVGPGLEGINQKRTEEWLINWIKNSQKMIEEGDEQAIAIYEEYNKVAMMPFDFMSDEEIRSILTYIDDAATETVAATENQTDTLAVSPAPAAPVNKGFRTIFYVTMGVLVIIAILLIYLMTLVRKVNNQLNPFDASLANHSTSFFRGHGLQFIIMLVIAVLVIYLLKLGLEEGVGNINMLVFAVFPYVAAITFIIGSIYRYRNTGFKVSSLSSQFLEGRKLFWGSQPFHWGLLLLFFGHLIAFLLPRSVIAWNGAPLRLLILEVTAFVAGCSVLLGLLLLIWRRLSSKRVLVVSNAMDMLVYVILLVQIVSGLGVAFYVRWGSSWFASTLTPYLRSIFALNPQIDAVSAMPWLVQIHIFSAFFLIAIIPFTRFMHFLVAPVDYLWRRYQLVLWNWNRKAIRITSQHNVGKRSRNH